MGHTSFIADESSQMHWFARVIFWERLHLSTMTARSLLGVEPHRPMTRRRELPVRLKLIDSLEDTDATEDEYTYVKNISPP